MLIFWAIFMLSIVEVVGAQTIDPMNCRSWTTTLSGPNGLLLKQFYIGGFIDGMAVTARVNVPNRDRAHAVIDRVWPFGMSGGQMISLIDKYCGLPQNEKNSILEAIITISREAGAR